MERIEQSLLSEKLDEILDRIDNEDIGFVITENLHVQLSGKDRIEIDRYNEITSESVGCHQTDIGHLVWEAPCHTGTSVDLTSRALDHVGI